MIRDLLFFMVFMFAFAFFVLAMFIAWNETNDAIQATSVITPQAKAMFDEQATRYDNYMDYSYLTILIAIVIGILVLSYFVSSEPLLFWALWLIIMIFGAVAGYLANAWIAATTDGPLSISVAQFPIMNYVLTNYMGVVIILGMLMLIVFFAKPSSGGYA